MIKKERFYTSGKFAKKVGVTLKTIRHYDKIGILKPTEVNEAGYRLYSEKDFEKLQRIVTFKYLGYSLEEIKSLMDEDVSKGDISRSIKIQRDYVQEKIKKMERVSRALADVEDMMKLEKEIQWDKFISVIEYIKLDEVFKSNFKTTEQLEERISIHDKYSLNKHGWHRWAYDNIENLKEKKVLEIGCGTGMLWERNKERIPDECKIKLLDSSPGMIKEVRDKFSDDDRFDEFIVGDILKLPFDDEVFDIVIANHIMYFIKDSELALKEMKRVLKKGGQIYTATSGGNNFKEVRQLLKEHNEEIIMSRIDIIGSYFLENGFDQMKEIFGECNCNKYEDDLEVTDEDDLMGYILSTTGNVRELLGKSQLNRVRDHIKDIIETKGKFHITKDVGILSAKK